METIKSIRASFAPIAVYCQASMVVDPGPKVRQAGDDELAKVGSATHAVCEFMVTNGDRPNDVDGWLANSKYAGVDANEVGFLSWYARQFWIGTEETPGYRGAFPEPLTETEMSETHKGILVSGHEDVMSLSAASVLDWKAGYRTDVDASPQMRVYGWLMSLRLPNRAPETVITATVVWLRDKTFQTWKWKVAELDRWMDEMLDKVKAWDGTFNTGDHCRYCPRYFDCPGQKAIVQSTVSSLASMEGDANVPMNILAAAYPAVQNVRRMCNAYADRVKLEILKLGALDAGNGMELILRESQTEKIDALKSWDTLTDFFSDDVEAIAACMTVGKTKLLKAVNDASPKGQKGKAQKRVMEQLRTAGAVTQSTRKSLALVKRQEPVKEIDNDAGKS